MSTFTNREDLDEMQHRIILHFIRHYTVCNGEKDRQTKEYNFFLNYNPTPRGVKLFFHSLTLQD